MLSFFKRRSVEQRASESAVENNGSALAGAYRRHRAEDIVRFTALACEAFPDFAGRIECFGADWLGDQFATDRGLLVEGKPQVVLLEPGTGKALKIPADIDTFHADLLENEQDAVLAASFFQQWLHSGGVAPGYDQCVGYRKPLYLSGADDVSNLEVCDLDVYWTITAQLFAKVRKLPDGTRIEDVTIGE
ncbi:T6SS immunity protein Tdi1 domain-containing protein [Sphingomonas oryzagri]